MNHCFVLGIDLQRLSMNHDLNRFTEESQPFIKVKVCKLLASTVYSPVDATGFRCLAFITSHHKPEAWCQLDSVLSGESALCNESLNSAWLRGSPYATHDSSPSLVRCVREAEPKASRCPCISHTTRHVHSWERQWVDTNSWLALGTNTGVCRGEMSGHEPKLALCLFWPPATVQAATEAFCFLRSVTLCV